MKKKVNTAPQCSLLLVISDGSKKKSLRGIAVTVQVAQNVSANFFSVVSFCVVFQKNLNKKLEIGSIQVQNAKIIFESFFVARNKLCKASETIF